jgi:TM2 domain-containing membrane protein YozV
MSRSWFVEHKGKIVGPVTSAQLKQLASASKIGRKTRVRLGEDGEWVSASKVQGLFPATEISPPKRELATAAASPPPVPSPVREQPTPVPAVAQKRPCPFCGEDIAVAAIKCRHCNEFLDGRPREVPQQQPVAAPQPMVNVTQVVNNTPGYMGPHKSKMVAFLLAIFLGGLGFHHFYMGHSVRGLLYLVFCWTFIPALIALVEAVLLLLQSNDSFQRSCR